MRIAPSQLTIREIIGQLMMPMLPDTADLADGATWDRVQADLERFSFGGYIVFRGDREKTPPFLAELQELTDLPLLFGADLECGAGQHLAGFTDFPNAMSLGATRDPDLAYQQGAITALEARLAGIHWIFAPSMDLATNPDNPIINTRGFGDEPRQVGLMGAAFISGVQRHRAIACAKHFPGHGETSVDSHHTLPVLDMSRHRLETADLIPFRQGIQAGVKSIMVGHLAVPALDEALMPATMSKRVILDLLREQMGFTGLVVTDALTMGAVVERYDPGTAAVRALQAGVDVLLMPPDPQAVVDAVLRAIEEGGLSKQRLLESVERIFDAKLDLGLWSPWDEDEEFPSQLPDYEPAVSAISDAAITLVTAREGVLPLGGDRTVGSIAIDDDDDPRVQAAWRLALAGHPEVPVAVVAGPAAESDVARAIEAVAACDVVVVAVFSAIKAWKNRVDLPEPLASIPERLRAAGREVVVVSFSSPFLLRQFPEVDAYVCAYSPHPLNQRAAVRGLWGELPMAGRLPVDLALPRT